MEFLEYRGFSQETEEFLLGELEYSDVTILGMGSQTHVFKAKKDNSFLALKIKFNDAEEVKVETELDKHRPAYFEKIRTIADMFGEKSKEITDLNDRYYKYMIVYRNSFTVTEELIKNLFDKEFEKAGMELTFEAIYEKVNSLSPCEDKVKNIGEKLEKTGTKGRFKRWLDTDRGIEAPYANAIIALLIHFSKSSLCIFTALLADEDLDQYITELTEIGIKEILDQLYKIAKHILKALESLHSMDFAHRDIHSGNITVTAVARGETFKKEYQLIDFGAGIDATDTDLKEAQKDDVRRIGYSLLIPIFWKLFQKDETYFPDNPDRNNASIDKIHSELKKSCDGDSSLDEKIDNFVSFLKILADGNFENAKNARELLDSLKFSD